MGTGVLPEVWELRGPWLVLQGFVWKGVSVKEQIVHPSVCHSLTWGSICCSPGTVCQPGP